MATKNFYNKKLRTSEDGLDLIKHFEGLRTEAYYCTGNKRTIGYGHLIGDYISTCTVQQAEEWLVDDVKSSERAVKSLVGVRLAQNQFDALVSFVFNLGAFNFKKSTLLKRINSGSHEDVPFQLSRWNKSGRPLKVTSGLTRRRKAEGVMYGTGEVDFKN